MYAGIHQALQMQSASTLHASEPQKPNGPIKGSLDPITPEGIPLEEDDLDFGEVEISSDGLLHPETAFPWRLGSNQDPSHLISFAQIDWLLRAYMQGLDHWGDWPASYSVPEQHHIWRIGEDVPLPDGLHVCVNPCWMGCEEREEPCEHRESRVPGGGRYILQISKPMTLQSLNTALDEWLAKYASVIHLNAWDHQEMYDNRFH